MDRSDGRSMSPYGGGVRDTRAGGKLRKPPTRKPPPSPYARPPAVAAQSSHRREGGGGWLSKIVAGSARYFPSFFSKSPSDCIDEEEDHDASDGNEEDNLNVDFQSSEVAGPSRVEDEPMCDTSIEEQRQDRNELSEIEQLLNGKSLSRDEISRLTEILNSKASSLSNADQGKQNYIMTGEGETVGTLVAHKNPRTSTEEKLEGLNKDLWGNSTPLPSSTVRDVVGASPVDIARAFMGSRTSETDFSSRTLISKVERVSADEYELKPAIPLPSPKPICWPGAIVQDQRGYMTPQNERGKLGLHNFPRTPYSRTIFSKSKSKLAQLQGGSSSCINTSSSSFQQFGSPAHEEVRSRGNVLDNRYGGSVGPIRRVRHNVVDSSPSRGSVSLNPYANNRSNLENPHTNASYSHVFKNLEPGMTGNTSKFWSEEKLHTYEVGSTAVPSQSTLIARKILEHIDRKMPTPAEKSAEIKLAMSSKRPLSSEASTVGRLDSRNDIGHQTFSPQKNEYAPNSLFNSHPEDRSALKTKDEGNQNTSASNLKIGNAVPSFDFIKNNDSQIKSMHEKTSMGFTNYKEKDNNELRPLHNYMNGQLATKTAPNTIGSNLNLKKPWPHTFGNKPVLPSISINKPVLSMSASLNSGFTFPVSATSGALTEPPTPSIMPSSSSSPTKEGPTIPTYTFGSKRSAPALVFSFPSTSNASALENSEIKFSFGSVNQSRVSFGAVGKDGIVIKT